MAHTQPDNVDKSEFRIPKYLINSLYEMVISLLMFVLMVFFIILAILVLIFFMFLPVISVVASVLWLVFIFFIIRDSCKEQGGLKQLLTNCMGVYAWHQFAEISKQDNEQKVICFGYRLFGKRYYYIRIPCNDIKAVVWEMGQASYLARKDKNDWQVRLWYHKPFELKDDTNKYFDPTTGVFVFGPYLKKEKIEVIGNNFVKFLRDNNAIDAKFDDSVLNGLIGKTGTVIEGCALLKVRIDDTDFHADSVKDLLEKDTKIKVVDTRGTTLLVEAIQ